MNDRSLPGGDKWLDSSNLHNETQTVHMNDGRQASPIPNGPSVSSVSSVVKIPGELTTEDTEKSAGSDRGLNAVSGRIVGAALKVHSTLGPGLLESAYEACLAHELRKLGLRVATQVALPVIYDGRRLGVGYRIDMLVEGSVVVELKVIDKLLPIHEAQLLSYLRLSGHRLGLLINFNVLRLKDGIRRMLNGY